jgi:hypothetical protein
MIYIGLFLNTSILLSLITYSVLTTNSVITLLLTFAYLNIKNKKIVIKYKNYNKRTLLKIYIYLNTYFY